MSPRRSPGAGKSDTHQHVTTRLRRLLIRYRYQAISFVTGFGLLSFELAAARVLAPSIGGSTYVWTGVIGVIIAALSLGFFVGGRVADNRNRATDLAWLLLLACVAVVGTLLCYESTLDWIADTDWDRRIQAVTAALLLFAPASFFIGMTSPYLAKLNVTSLALTGRSIANLDMFNAIGGILGTFTTGFILFGFIGSHQTISMVALLLLLASWSIAPRVYTRARVLASAVLLLCMLTPPNEFPGVISIDTASAHYQVINGTIRDESVIGLVTGPSGTQSAVYQNGINEPVFWYTREVLRLAELRQPNDILILGGGAFTVPQYLSERFPDSTIDVVEIDPELESISTKYFGYTSPSNVNEIFTDARTYVNQSDKQYDFVLVDVYGDASIPFTFMTTEYAQALKRIVADDGVVLANIIGGFSGACRESFGSVDAAYRSAFENAYYANESGVKEARANHIVLYSQEPVSTTGLKPLPSFLVAPYTDNFAPAERLHYRCQGE